MGHEDGSQMGTKIMGQAAIAWAVACDVRTALIGVRVTHWPAGGFTLRERRYAERAMQHVEEAEECIRALQASLSERSKLTGEDQPNYTAAREMNQP